LLQVKNQYILIDCGEGTQLQLNKYNVKPGKIKHILISHLHGDHYFGLIGLLSTMHLYHRTSPLKIYGPPPLMDILTMQLNASETRLSFEIEFTELQKKEIHLLFENNDLIIQNFPLSHGINCYGFVIKEKPKEWRINKSTLTDDILLQEILTLKKGHDVLFEDGSVKYDHKIYTLPPRKSRSYAYCSDTKYDESILEHIYGVDVLYHEATFSDEMKDRALQTFHSTASQAATIAKKAHVDRLLLGHYSTRYKDPAPLLQEAIRIFENSHLTFEGETIILEE
jgi:ribonuclease Z